MKSGGRFVYNLFRWKRRRAASGNQAAATPAAAPVSRTEGAESDAVDGNKDAVPSDGSHNAAASGSGQDFPRVRDFAIHLSNLSVHTCTHTSTYESTPLYLLIGCPHS